MVDNCATFRFLTVNTRYVNTGVKQVQPVRFVFDVLSLAFKLWGIILESLLPARNGIVSSKLGHDMSLSLADIHYTIVMIYTGILFRLYKITSDEFGTIIQLVTIL